MVRKIKIEKRCKKKKMKQRRFTNKKLIALMLPLAVDQLLNSFMGTVDTLVVSNLGSAAISAVSLVDSINILVVQAFFALASGERLFVLIILDVRRKREQRMQPDSYCLLHSQCHWSLRSRVIYSAISFLE